jgi:RNA polymerase sigma-70 factor (TIGR02960 family)
MPDGDLLDLARAGDEAAFTAVVMPHRRELHVHCYRMLGNFDDADDAVQEALLAAWRGIGEFGGRASVRTWLYRIATNTCLNMLRGAARRPQPASRARSLPVEVPAHLPATTPVPSGHTEVTWLQPYPDVLLDDLPVDALGPESVAMRNEAISLAFTAALQVLSPRARAVLVLRDVLGFTGREAGGILGVSQESVAMTLSRARAAIRDSRGEAGHEEEGTRGRAPRLAAALAQALAAHDVEAVVRLLADDVRISMPPTPAIWEGRALAAAFLTEVAFRLVPAPRFIEVSANRQPALAVYSGDAASGAWRANGLLVITARAAGRGGTEDGGQIAAITRFESGTLRPFGLPGLLPGEG